jgi:hypothetical protein
MKTSFSKFVGVILLALSLGTAAHALPITGSIGFTGPYTANNDNLTLATTLTFGTVEVTGVHDGDFSGIATGTVATTPAFLSVNPTVLPATPIWEVGGFALTLSSLVEIGNTPTSLTLEGFGEINAVGFDPTPGYWVGTFNRAGTNFTFSASSNAEPVAVPDGGASAVLLGTGLIAVGLATRRFKFGRR